MRPIHTKIGWALFGIGLMGCPSALIAQTAPITATAATTTTIEHTQFGEASDQELAEYWKLSREEVARYRHYMRVEGRYFYGHLDPVMTLGIITADPVQRARYAGLYLEAERQRVRDQTSFAQLVADVQLRRYGLEPPVDFSTLPQVANSPGYQAARAGRHATPVERPDRPTAPPATPAEPVVPQAGDVVEVLVEPGCTRECADAILRVLKIAGVTIRVYGRHFKTTQALVDWLEQAPLAPLDASDRVRIEPRRFDPLIFNGIVPLHPPVVLLRRQGAVIGRL
ncbi:MAG: hypothetical protein R3F40_12290 [Candidatus Competibacteraceae bacterium]